MSGQGDNRQKCQCITLKLPVHWYDYHKYVYNWFNLRYHCWMTVPKCLRWQKRLNFFLNIWRKNSYVLTPVRKEINWKMKNKKISHCRNITETVERSVSLIHIYMAAHLHRLVQTQICIYSTNIIINCCMTPLNVCVDRKRIGLNKKLMYSKDLKTVWDTYVTTVLW